MIKLKTVEECAIGQKVCTECKKVTLLYPWTSKYLIDAAACDQCRNDLYFEWIDALLHTIKCERKVKAKVNTSLSSSPA